MKHPLEKKLKISFQNQKLLNRALTHRSYLNEHPKEKAVSNERLEFLGDAVLEFLTSQFLYQKFPSFPEGKLTNLRSKLVCDRSLAHIAQKLNLGKHLHLSHGEEESGGRNNPSLLSDALEALIGALYLDQNLKIVTNFLQVHLFPTLEQVSQYPDFKSNFQEIAQTKFKITPDYKTIKAVGPDHEKIFTIAVFLQNKLWGRGVGKSKQEAEQKAAQQALQNLSKTNLRGWSGSKPLVK